MSGDDTNKDAKALSQNVINNLNTGITTPTPLSADTVKTLQGITNTAGQAGFTTGLNNAFNTTAGLAQTGGLDNTHIPGLTDTLSAVQGISTGGVSTGAGDFNPILAKYNSLYGQANVPTSTATNLQGQIAGLKDPSYADTQAKSLYQNTLGPSFAQQGYQDIYHELQDPSFAENGYQSIFNKLNGPTTTEQNLGGYANGSLINANPYLDAAIKAANANTTGTVNSSFGANGRLGSGLNVGVLGNTLANNETSARLNQYNQDVQNQFGANAAIEAAKGQAVGQQEGALAGSDTARNNRYSLQSQALGGQDAATNTQLQRSLSALTSQDQFRLNQLGALTNTTGAIDTSNNNLTNTLSGLLAGQTSAASAKTSAAQNATGLQLNAANSLLGANNNAVNNQLNAANSLGGQFANALAPNLAALAATQGLDAPNQSQFNNSLSVLNALGGGSAPGVAAQTPWWQSVLSYVGGNASNAIKNSG